ncbi:MAG: SPOR domain-containing protein, partial [Bacteroidota bacterium]
ASSVKSDAELAKMQGKSEDKTKEEHKEIYTKVPEEEKPEEKKMSAEQEKQLPEKEKMEEVKREEPKRDFGIKPRQPVIKTVSSSDTESSPHGTTKSKPMDFPKTGSKEKTGISSAKKDKTPKLTKQKHKEGGLPPALKWVAFTVVPLLIIIVVLALNYDYIFGDKSVVFNRESETPAVQQTEDVQDEEFADEAPTTDDQAETDQPEQVQDVHSTHQQGRMVYYVIVGSFEEEHSALILVEELKNEGAQNARVFPVNPQGFYRVAYGFYYDLAEAETVLQDAKQINENAWILHRQN